MLTSWMLPLLVGMPLASSDLYSYAAQAQLARHGLDPYTTTPADLPAVDLGKFLDNVAWKWVDTPSPYGPLWVAVSKWVAAATGNHALISVLLLRLLPFAAVLLTARLLPVLARRFDRRADLALWLAVANPLILVHAVGGGHNDAVMVALIVAGLVVITRPGADWRQLAAGVALMTLAAAVKSPGLVAIGFVVPIYLAGRRGWSWRDCARYCAGALAIAVLVFAVVSLIAGVGLGWTRQVSSGRAGDQLHVAADPAGGAVPGRDRRRARRHPGRRHRARLPHGRHDRQRAGAGLPVAAGGGRPAGPARRRCGCWRSACSASWCSGRRCSRGTSPGR